MPTNERDRRVLAEAQVYCKSKSQFPARCAHYQPTLADIESTTFSDYVRRVVLRGAEPKYEDEIEPPPTVSKTVCGSSSSNPTSEGAPGPASPSSTLSEEHLPSAVEILEYPPMPYSHGMAKVTLPHGFIESGGVDPTGRGPAWDRGTTLGDMILPSPIKQVLRGIGGIYEYTFLDLEPISAADFRERADEYFKSQVGTKSEIPVELLERKFWKRLGPTMQAALYGADMEGTLFPKKDDCYGWNISKLNSCLELLLLDQPEGHEGGLPGVTTPYLYFGMWASVFCAHTEDMNLLSINYLHAGAPKIWYAVAAGEDAKRLEQFCEGHYHHSKNACPEYMRHKRALISPAILKKAGIPFTTTVQYPGDAMITFPGSYHFGFNTGFNVAEATNFAVPEWIPYGKLANVCLCRPDSVRIDMNKFERLLLQYEREVKQSKRLSWRDWALRLKKKRKEKEHRHGGRVEKERKSSSDGRVLKTKEFWVEVVQSFTARKYKAVDKGSRKRRKTNQEVWHLAKPGNRKSLRPSTRILCIVPAVVDGDSVSDDSSQSDEDEQCFAGTIVEETDNYVRIHFEGTSKKEDTWMPIDSPKIFLDGGRWDEDDSAKLPALHYWREEDSKQRCV